MKAPPLEARELEMLRSVLGRHPEIESANVYGSRAKGTHTPRSDVDLVLAGRISPIEAEAIAAELDELPLPYRFDVQALEHVEHPSLLAHIQRVGIEVYRAADPPRCV